MAPVPFAVPRTPDGAAWPGPSGSGLPRKGPEAAGKPGQHERRRKHRCRIWGGRNQVRGVRGVRGLHGGSRTTREARFSLSFPPPHGDGGALHAPSTLTRDGAGGFWRHVSAPVSHGVSSFLHSCGPRACRSSRGNTRQNQARPTIRTQSELCARSPVRPDVAFTAASPLRQRRTSFRSLESAPYVG